MGSRRCRRRDSASDEDGEGLGCPRGEASWPPRVAPLTVRLAAIDLGSNTIRLLVAEGDPRGGLEPVHGEQLVVRLGAGLTESGRLGPEALARTLAVVRAYRDRARTLGAQRVITIATAAVRAAANRDEIVHALSSEPYMTFRVVSGDEEARLTLLGVAWGLPVVASPFCVLDVGGGSTELIVAEGARPRGGVSVPLGVVGLAERFFRADPLDWVEYSACRAHIVGRLEAEAWPTIHRLGPRAAVGTAGTITTLAALDLQLATYDPARVHGHRLRAAAIRSLLERLGALHLAERAREPCLEPGRADLIIPGIAITLAVLEGLGLDEVRVSDVGLREGILLEAAGWTPPVP